MLRRTLGDKCDRNDVVFITEKSNYAIKPTPEQALRTNRTKLPARLIAALDFARCVVVLGDLGRELSHER